MSIWRGSIVHLSTAVCSIIESTIRQWRRLQQMRFLVLCANKWISNSVFQSVDFKGTFSRQKMLLHYEIMNGFPFLFILLVEIWYFIYKKCRIYNIILIERNMSVTSEGWFQAITFHTIWPWHFIKAEICCIYKWIIWGNWKHKHHVWTCVLSFSKADLHIINTSNIAKIQGRTRFLSQFKNFAH